VTYNGAYRAPTVASLLWLCLVVPCSDIVYTGQLLRAQCDATSLLHTCWRNCWDKHLLGCGWTIFRISWSCAISKHSGQLVFTQNKKCLLQVLVLQLLILC